MAETLRDLGVVVDHPAPKRLRGRRGRRRLAVRAARGGGQDARQLHAPRAAPGALRRVIISNPGGDRIGRRPVDLHVDAMRALGATIDYRNGYYFANAPGRLRGDGGPLPVRVGHGHRERDARRDPGRGPHGHPAGRPGAGGRRPHRVPPEDGRRGRADVSRTRSRSRASKRLRGAEHRVIPDRIEAGTFVVAAAVTGGQVTLQGAPCDHLERVRRGARRVGVGRRLRRPTRSRSTARRSHAGGFRASTSRPRRTRASRPTSSRRRRCCSPRPRATRTSTRRSSRTASSG